MIFITGAIGTLGRDIIDRLLAQLPADQVGVSVRDPQQASGLAERGVRVRRGDVADPAGLSAAFEGADQVLIVSAGALGDIAVRWDQAGIHAAADAGVRRIRSAVDPTLSALLGRPTVAVRDVLQAALTPQPLPS